MSVYPSRDRPNAPAPPARRQVQRVVRPLVRFADLAFHTNGQILQECLDELESLSGEFPRYDEIALSNYETRVGISELHNLPTLLRLDVLEPAVGMSKCVTNSRQRAESLPVSLGTVQPEAKNIVEVASCCIEKPSPEVTNFEREAPGRSQILREPDDACLVFSPCADNR